MGDSDITGNDGMNSTETESCGASGGYVGSVKEFSNPCQPCLENDRNIDSLLYCVECEDYLCEKCVEMHRMVKPTKKHKLVPKDVLNNCGDELMIRREEECPIHMNEIAIASTAETTNTQSIEEKIAETQSKLNDAIEKRNVDITNLDEDRNDSLQVLEQIKVDTEDTFQRLLRSLEAENQKVENIYKKEKDEILADIENYSRIIKGLNTTLTLLQKENICLEYKFIQMKKAEQQIQAVQKAIIAAPSKPVSHKIGYERDKQYDKNLAAFQRFGFFKSDKRTYTSSESRRINIIQRQEKVATVFDICEAGDDKILITDWINCCVKVIDTNKAVVSSTCQISSNPFGICKLEDGAFAVTITHCRKVSIIEFHRNMPDRLKERLSFETGEYCRGIAYSNKKLFVACGGRDEKEGPGHIRMFDTEGNILKTVTNDSFRKAIVGFPCKIPFLPGVTTALITDVNNLIHLNVSKDDKFDIKKLNTTMAPQTKYASVCFDANGHALIAETSTKSIKLLSKDYTSFEPVVTGLQQYPLAISFDHLNLKLYVGLWKSEDLLCFQLDKNIWDKPSTFSLRPSNIDP
ncbi:uncharacterized protein LOC132729348 [Ruditapes philippinarum]|uniref:uncharacterized protein LOC132729348 n=1 Tax=Ruditapes philippinarum TaxID=129788 RepID=UPI00295A6F62|nr:uncharacterized protein LOC132729348 [Ruditapes philippinarum]